MFISYSHQIESKCENSAIIGKSHCHISFYVVFLIFYELFLIQQEFNYVYIWYGYYISLHTHTHTHADTQHILYIHTFEPSF